MKLKGIDWVIIAGHFLITPVLASIYIKKAGKGIIGFFAAGQSRVFIIGMGIGTCFGLFRPVPGGYMLYGKAVPALLRPVPF